MKRIIGLLGTLMIHLAVAASFVSCPAPSKPRPQGEDGDKRNITFLELKKEVPREPHQSLPETAAPTLLPIEPPAVMYCEQGAESYEGVGIRYWSRNGVVLEAPPSYPGYQAGIRVGDIILTPNPPNVDGYMTFSVQQDRSVISLKIKVTTVCFNVQEEAEEERP